MLVVNTYLENILLIPFDIFFSIHFREASVSHPTDDGDNDYDGDGVDVDDLGHLFYRRNSLKIRLQMGFRLATSPFLLHTPPPSPFFLKFHASWEWIAAAQLQLSTADRTKAKLEAAIFV